MKSTDFKVFSIALEDNKQLKQERDNQTSATEGLRQRAVALETELKARGHCIDKLVRLNEEMSSTFSRVAS